MRNAVHSLFFDVHGPVHVTDFGGPAGAATVVCVHGLGSSSTGWTAFAAALIPSYRVLAVDLPGHGRTPATGRSLSVLDAAAVLEAVLDQLGVGPVVLVGHSMGAVVSVLAAVSAPAAVDRLMLLAPPSPREGLPIVSKDLLPHVALCLWPRLGLRALKRRLAQQTLEEYVWDRLRLTCASVAELPHVVEAMTAELQAAYDGGEDPLASFIHAARSVGLLVAQGGRYREALAAVQQPVQVVHGALDRVLNPTGLQQLRALQPRWGTHLLAEVGHSPHLEAPTVVAHLLKGHPFSPDDSASQGALGDSLAAACLGQESA